MRFLPKARLGVVTNEDKETRLKAFIGKHIEQTAAEISPATSTVYRLLTLSAESPAARVLAGFAAELSAAHISVEAVFARHERGDAPYPANCRFVTDLRLLDAHEQLVLDHETVWIGDCMRRDPLRRDAFEFYAERCPYTAANADRSFARIWRAAGPSGSLTGTRTWTGPRTPSLFDPALLAGADQAPSPAVLRH